MVWPCANSANVVARSYAARCEHAQRTAEPGAGAQDGQGAGSRLRHAHGRRAAAALPAPLLHPRRADRPVLAARRRPRHRAGPGRPRRHAQDAQQGIQRRPGRGGHHRRPRQADPDVLLAQRRRSVRHQAAGARRGRHVRGHRFPLPHPAPAGPPGVRTAARGAAERGPLAGAGGRVRRRDDPGLPGQRQGQLVDDRPGGQDRAGPAGRGGGPAPGRAQGAARARRPGRGDPRHPPAARPGRPEAGQGAAQVGRGVPAAGRAGAAAAGRRGHAGHAAPARRRRHRRRVRRAAAVHPDRGAGRGGRDDRRGAGLRLPDAPAAAGRGRLGQDGDRDPGHAPGGGRGRAGGPARPDRGARPAALPVRHRHARPAGPGRPARRGRARHRRGPAHRVGRGGRPASGAVRRVHRRRRDRDRHPRPARGAGPVRRPGPGGDRRAAQVRGGAA